MSCQVTILAGRCVIDCQVECPQFRIGIELSHIAEVRLSELRIGRTHLRYAKLVSCRVAVSEGHTPYRTGAPI